MKPSASVPAGLRRIVDVDGPLEPLEVPSGTRAVLLLVYSDGAFVGDIVIRPRRATVLTPEEQWQAVLDNFGYVLTHRRVRGVLETALGWTPLGTADAAPRVSVIVCTRDRPAQLAACLASLQALRAPAHEVIVVDNAPTDERTRDLCKDLPVTYVREDLPGQTRARNRGIAVATGDVVAFTDDDCVADPGWLDNLAIPFADPLVMAVTGYIGPLEIAAPAQLDFELHGGFQRHAQRRVFHRTDAPALLAAAVVGAGANMLFRREVFARIGMFAEDLGPGTPARSSDDKYAFYRVLQEGFRIVYEPERVIWHRHRSDAPGLQRIMEDYGVAEFAYTLHSLREHGDLTAVRLWRWWIRHYLEDVRRHRQGHPRAVPLSMTLSEVRGALKGPGAMARSTASRRGIPPIPWGDVAATTDATPAEAPRVQVRRAESPTTTVTIASYNRRDRLERVLAKLNAQDYPSERFEVVVVLDGSTDGSAEMVRAFEAPYDLRLHEQPNSGLASARNAGARAAAHPVVVFLDDDIEPTPGLVAAHAAAHRDAPTEHYALGYYPPAFEGDDLWGVTMRRWWEDHFRRKAEPNHRWTLIDVVDGNSSIPGSLFDRLGGFDEAFRGGRRQDHEFGYRVLTGGVPLAYHPQARGDHHFDARLETSMRNAFDEGRWDVVLSRKHPQARAFLPLGHMQAIPRNRKDSSVFDAALRAPAATRAVSLAAARRLIDASLEIRALRVIRKGITMAYLQGVRAGLGPAAWADYVDEDPVVAKAVDVWLDRPGATLAVPDRMLEPLDVCVGIGGRRLVRVPAIGPSGQWDWDDLVARVAETAAWRGSLSWWRTLPQDSRGGEPATADNGHLAAVS